MLQGRYLTRLGFGVKSENGYGHLMEKHLRQRLTFGPLMFAALFLLLWLDHAGQKWTTGIDIQGHQLANGVAGMGLLALLLLVLPVATIELATLFAAERVKPYRF